MCGIMGYCDRTGNRPGELGPTLLKMLDALGRRGPDSAGIALYNARPDGTELLRVKLADEANGGLEERAAEVARRAGQLAAIQGQERNGEYLRLSVGYEGEAEALIKAVEDVHP
jgi:glutamate synthase domain-containing protein 1